MEYELLIEILENYLLMNADVMEEDERRKIAAQLLKLKLHQAFTDKLVKLNEYVDSMIAELGDQNPETYGLDPEFNVGEIIKELTEL